MASDYLHLDLIDRVAADARLPVELGRLLQRHRAWARLGAVWVDVPYFEGLGRRLVGDLLGRADRPAPWGDRWHWRDAHGLVRLALLAARDRPDPGPLVAFALGHLTHAALDVATHPQVNAWVAEAVARGDPHHAAVHRQVENVQVELFWREVRQRPLFGTREALWLLAPARTLLTWGADGQALLAVLRRERGLAPSLAEVRSWALGLGEYALLAAGPLVRRYLPETALAAQAAWYRDGAYRFERVVQAATERSVEAVTAAWASFGAPGGLAHAAFHQRFPEVDLDDPSRPVAPLE
jgi:hypothetical protein